MVPLYYLRKFGGMGVVLLANDQEDAEFPHDKMKLIICNEKVKLYYKNKTLIQSL